MPTIYCRHIKVNGKRCCSPAITGKCFCHFHININARMRALNPPADLMPTIIHPLNTDNERQRNPIVAEYFAGYAPNPGPLTLDFPPIEDRESVQVALSMLLCALGQNRLDPKRASTMLYGLQVASTNAQKLNLEPGENKIVRATIVDETGNELAPDEDPQEITEFNEWLANYDDDDEEDD